MYTSKKQAFEAAQVNSILSIGADSKTVKGQTKGYLTGIIYMLSHTDGPAAAGMKGTLCPNAVNAGCDQACLVSAGRGSFSSVIEGRKKRTLAFLERRDAFMIALWYDIAALTKRAERASQVPCVRLNGTSDIDYTKITFTAPNGETGNIFQHFPHITFYDYTKNVHYKREQLPDNYYLTFSYSQFSDTYAHKALSAAKRNESGLAVVFRDRLPETFMGLPVVDADKTDLRFTDKETNRIKGAYIAGLKAKGKAKKDTSGFVIDDNKSNTTNLIAVA